MRAFLDSTQVKPYPDEDWKQPPWNDCYYNENKDADQPQNMACDRKVVAVIAQQPYDLGLEPRLWVPICQSCLTIAGEWRQSERPD